MINNEGKSHAVKGKNIVIFLCLLFFLALCAGLQAEETQRNPLNIAGKHFLPLRVLSRPFANMYKEANEKSAIIQENVPAFSSYIVYTKPETSSSSTEVTGWYEIGSDDSGHVLGWMKAADVMEWKQSLCLSFSHPVGRKPVLMFKDVIPLLKLINLPSEKRKSKSLEYYAQISAGQTSPAIPVVAIEPSGFIDITKQFYLLPILEYTPVEIEGREARLIKLTSALRKDSPKKKSLVTVDPTKKFGSTTALLSKRPLTITNVAGATQAVTTSSNAVVRSSSATTSKINMDIVFVVDMTNGMQP